MEWIIPQQQEMDELLMIRLDKAWLLVAPFGCPILPEEKTEVLVMMMMMMYATTTVIRYCMYAWLIKQCCEDLSELP